MNTQDRSIISTFPKALDLLVNGRFKGAKCSTGFSIIEMTYVTTWNRKHKKAEQIRSFIDGFMAGNEDLAKRLERKETEA
mgnify:CR=1 FL=1